MEAGEAFPDLRDASTKRLDLLIDQITQLSEIVERSIHQDNQRHTQTVVHKTAGPGGLLAAAVTACFCTLFFLVIVVLMTNKDQERQDGQIRDLQAWKDVHSNDISALKAKVGK